MTDLALVNANVLTMDPDRPRASAVAITGGRIEALDASLDRLNEAGRVVDLRGATVLPGFHDAHNHMIGFGMSLAEVDLRSSAVGSLDELYAAIARRAETTAPGEWVVGAGYDQNKLGAHPHRDALDRAAPGRRVWLRHTSGHMCVVNSPVLADLGLDAAATELPGGRVATDDGGRPTGLLEERAQLLVGSLVYPYPLSELTQAIGRAAERIPEGRRHQLHRGRHRRRLDRAQPGRARRLPGRQGHRHARGPGRADGGQRGAAPARRARQRRPGGRAGPGHQDRLRRRLAPARRGEDIRRRIPGGAHRRADRPVRRRRRPGDGRGYLQADAADLQATIIAAHRSGWQVATHAIGDLAIDVVLDAYERALAAYPRRDPRHRIEHFAVVQPRQVARAAGLGVIAVPQGRFATELGDGMLAAVGPARHGWLYRQRSLLEAGMVLPGSSDRPVVAGAPLLGIADMVNRRTASGAPFNPGEAITAQQALHAYTRGSAYASRQEHVKGSIAPGMLADLVVLSEDPTAVSPERIAGLAVLATIVDGHPRYDAGAFDGLS